MFDVFARGNQCGPFIILHAMRLSCTIYLKIVFKKISFVFFFEPTVKPPPPPPSTQQSSDVNTYMREKEISVGFPSTFLRTPKKSRH